ncbi:MAG: divergent PAP2 family protein [Clostridia bacterium]|nr:divergent PAP2 family protein [Clostridia bacterium]MBO5207599.1 divergent PAP2 family protein [Clostridia bacterium]
MGTVFDVFLNPVLLVPIIAWLLAQVLKLIINSLMNRRFTISRLVGDGGMPSGHSATVTSLAAMCGIQCGFASVEFAIAAVLAVIVMHDATGVRRETGKQAESIISIVSVINNYLVEKDEELKTEKLKILVGHTHLQVVCGAILGLLVALGYFWIFNT